MSLFTLSSAVHRLRVGLLCKSDDWLWLGGP